MNDDIRTRTDECYRCGYDLRGIGDERPCPECGLLAQRSRRTTDELHDTRPRWLRSISRGADLILAAVALSVAWTFGQNLLFDQVIVPRLRSQAIGGAFSMQVLRISYTFPFYGFEVAAILLLAGVFLLTRREDYPPDDRADRWLRWALRRVAVVPLLSLMLYHLRLDFYIRSAFTGRAAPRLDWLETIALWLGGLASIPLPVLLFFRLQSLAHRARSAHLAEHCAIVGIGTSSAVLYLFGMLYVLNHAQRWGWGTNWEGRSRVALRMVVALATAAFLFTLWSLYLLIRFAIAFRVAAMRLRQKWTRDDRATAEVRSIGMS